jgi:transposase
LTVDRNFLKFISMETIIKIIKWSLGIDVGAKSIRCCLSSIDSTQKVKVKASRKFNNTAAGLEELLLWIRKHYQNGEVPLSIAMEATGVYYERCALLLQKESFRVSVVLPTKAKRYLQAVGLKSKNDKIDAEGLARMGAEQQLTEWSVASRQMYGLRLLTRQHEDLQKSITSFNNQLHAISNGMYRFVDIEKTYQDTLSGLQDLLKQVENAISESVKANDALKQKVALLCSIKGVGELTAATIIAETNGFALFENQKQLESFSGYDVVENQSGDHVGKTKISKKGNSHIRRILHMAALNVVTYNVAPFVDLYERVYPKTNLKMKGYVAVQRKLLVILYTLYKKNEKFDRDYRQKTIREKELEPSFGLASQKS